VAAGFDVWHQRKSSVTQTPKVNKSFVARYIFIIDNSHENDAFLAQQQGLRKRSR